MSKVNCVKLLIKRIRIKVIKALKKVFYKALLAKCGDICVCGGNALNISNKIAIF